MARSSSPSWGLVLSGGSAFGIANAGVLEVLEHEHLMPDCLAGSSMGAIVGALWATGHSTKEMLNLCTSLNLLNIAAIERLPWKDGKLHEGLVRQRITERLSPLLGSATIADCRIPFVCVAGRVLKPVEWKRILQKGFTEYVADCIEPYVFPQETKLLDAILASSALPVLFHPVKIGKDTFIDLTNFGSIPASHLRDCYHPTILIATDTNPRYTDAVKFLPPSWQEYVKEGFRVLDANRAICDIVITPKLKGSSFRFDQAMEFYKKGKEAVEEALPKIKALFSKQ